MKTMKNNNWGRDAGTDERPPHIYVVNGKEHSKALPKAKRRKLPKYVKLFIAILGMYLLVLFIIGSYQLWQLNKQMNALELEQKSLLTQQQKLTEDMESLNNPEMIERIARESLRMVKPGETVIIPAASANKQ